MSNLIFRLNYLIGVTGKYALSGKLREIVKRQAPIHIVFAIVDHYEPGTGYVDKQTEMGRVNMLVNKFPELANKHKDSSGRPPKRTWFFPPHYHRYYALKKLTSLCELGYGEIEMHLHHGKTRPDNADNFSNTILKSIEEYSRFGIFGKDSDRKMYGFIHGDWALDNSRGGKYCGVNNEINMLIETGCYADFTFPCMCEANPTKINSIYYAKDNPKKAKSYDSGVSVEKNGRKNDGLMIIQGPLYPFWKHKTLLGIRTWSSCFEPNLKITNDHVDSWVNTGIHILGQPNVIFIKAHMHGASHGEKEFEEISSALNYLENNYNDGKRHILHYITAREMYNIIKAIEAGEEIGNNIKDFIDYRITAPTYDSSPDIKEASGELMRLLVKTYS